MTFDLLLVVKKRIARLSKLEYASPNPLERDQAARERNRMVADGGIAVLREFALLAPIGEPPEAFCRSASARTAGRSPRRARTARRPAKAAVDTPPEPPAEPPRRRPDITAAPLAVSDASAPAVVGLSPRQFRAFVREHGLPAVKAGRRTLIRADVLLDALDRLSGSTPRGAPWDEDAIVAEAAGGRR